MNQRPSLTELSAFTAIVRHASFRIAADELGMSPSTLSHMMRSLEEGLGLRLFNRTTRSVAPTEAGARLFRSLTPVLSELDLALADVGTFRDRPSGSLRINAHESSVRRLMRKVVPTFRQRYPEMHLDLVSEGKLVDIVAEGFDAGIRLSEAVPQDMIAIPLGPDGQFLAVASPDYLKVHGTPRTPDELSAHRCIRFRLPSGKIYRWEFERYDQELRIDRGRDHFVAGCDAVAVERGQRPALAGEELQSLGVPIHNEVHIADAQIVGVAFVGIRSLGGAQEVELAIESQVCI